MLGLLLYEYMLEFSHIICSVITFCLVLHPYVILLIVCDLYCFIIVGKDETRFSLHSHLSVFRLISLHLTTQNLILSNCPCSHLYAWSPYAVHQESQRGGPRSTPGPNDSPVWTAAMPLSSWVSSSKSPTTAVILILFHLHHSFIPA